MSCTPEVLPKACLGSASQKHIIIIIIIIIKAAKMRAV